MLIEGDIVSSSVKKVRASWNKEKENSNEFSLHIYFTIDYKGKSQSDPQLVLLVAINWKRK